MVTTLSTSHRARLAGRFAILLVLTASGFMARQAFAADGTLKVEIREAKAFQGGNDDTFGPQQDFFAISSIDFGPPVYTPEIGNHDHASWSPAVINTKLVPGRNQRYFDLYFELWDNDDANADEGFDISPQNGLPTNIFSYHINTPDPACPHVQYDVCTGQMEVKGINGSGWIPVGSNYTNLDGYNTSPGYSGNWGILRMAITREPANWLPDDIAVTLVAPVQTVYEPARAVADKETSLQVKVASSYPFSIQAPLTAEITDGINTVQETRTVWIQPGLNVYVLFDGTGPAPFRPYKPQVIPSPNVGVLNAWARVDYTETVSPNAPLELQDCANINNTGNATTLPLVHVTDQFTVYAPFDYDEDLNFLTSPQLSNMFVREEKFRLATWPLASLNGATTGTQMHRDHGSNLPFTEPFTTIALYNIGASQAGIDRLVLSVRPGWFADNAFRHQNVAQGSVGWSLGWLARHAVLAENGSYATAVHELGHTYDLSVHPCSTGGLLNLCGDEYSHALSDGAPYEAVGYDVHGDVYPNGVYLDPNWPNLHCPNPAAGGRDICAPNIMDFNCPGGFCNWIDNPSFDFLIDQLPHIDPFVVSVSGIIHLPDGAGVPPAPPIVEGMMPFFSYQHLGTQDMPDAPLSEMGEAFSGYGAFRIRLVTRHGVRDYRFNPRWLDNAPNPDVTGGFSINIPWDPETMAIQLIGPTNLRDEGCQNRLCPGEGMLLEERTVTPQPPTISDVRAGIDIVPPPTPPGGTPAVPVIGPGHDVVLAWNRFDLDSSDVRSLILVMRQGAAGGPADTPMPVAVDITGDTLRIPHERLTNAPGRYQVRAFVSDGVNTTEGDSLGAAWEICNFTNGGVETCNGIDENCDGVIDNGNSPGSIIDVTLNPQPFPPAPLMQWEGDPNAQSYDVVYGDLGTLRATGGDFSRAILGCLVENTTMTSAQVGPGPIQGQAFFYLVRGGNCVGPGTWNEKNPGPVQIDRDPGINASTAACRP